MSPDDRLIRKSIAATLEDIVDPQLKTIEGWELKNRRYVPAGRGQGTLSSNLFRFPIQNFRCPGCGEKHRGMDPVLRFKTIATGFPLTELC